MPARAAAGIAPGARAALAGRLGRPALAARQAAAVLAPVWCAACGRGGEGRAVCASCLRALRGELDPRIEALTGVEALMGVEALTGAAAAPILLATSLEYGGTGSALLAALKERGRVDAAAPLAAALGAAIRHAVEAHVAAGAAGPSRFAGLAARGGLALVAVPSRQAAVRRRGFRHVELLAARATGREPLRGALRHARAVDDQAGLGLAGRRRNLEGALLADPRLAGRRILLVDDVVTTGASVREALRALAAAGAVPVAAAAIARVPRGRPAGKPGASRR